MSGRTILITGATGKIGGVLVKHFLAAGDRVIAVGRNQAPLDEMARQGPQGYLHTIALDLMVENSSAELLHKLDSAKLAPDGLINNARSIASLRIGADGRVARDDFIAEFKLDVVVPYELSTALAEQSGGRLKSVVNIGSQYGGVAPNLKLYTDPESQSPLHYGVAKAALEQLTRELAVRLAARGVRVNCVAFGGVEGRVDDAFKQRYAALSPQGRMLGEHELAGPVDLLLSDSASAMTGHVMRVDGGWSIW